MIAKIFSTKVKFAVIIVTVSCKITKFAMLIVMKPKLNVFQVNHCTRLSILYTFLLQISWLHFIKVFTTIIEVTGCSRNKLPNCCYFKAFWMYELNQEPFQMKVVMVQIVKLNSHLQYQRVYNEKAFSMVELIILKFECL